MDKYIANCIQQPDKNVPWNDYKRLESVYDEHLILPNNRIEPDYSKTELASFVFQIRRAFYHTQNALIGQSKAMTQLRARVWNSIFTHDMKRYLRSLFYRMENVFTLIEGPSGSGKELVARAIGFSRFIPFDKTTRKFSANYRQVFFPINLSALSETLIESELFGHQKGAFTGALQNRPGYFESCGPYGTVFLDEIGETDPSVQVKLLRVLQTRQFQRLGDTQSRRFEGKVMAATNRNLETEMHEGNFRTDFYYRLCADRIETPLLATMVHHKKELELMVGFIAEKIAGSKEKENLTTEVTTWIKKSMPENYSWPGNFRELEQCVRNVMVHGEYRAQKEAPSTESEEASANVTTPTLNQWIQTLVNREYAKTPNLAQVADRLQVDRRTVKKYLSHRNE
jgi:transcriptional regulator with GAF, ATPase, and Fis domain